MNTEGQPDHHGALSKQLGRAVRALELAQRQNRTLYDRSKISSEEDVVYCASIIRESATTARKALKAVRRHARRLADQAFDGSD